MRLCLRSGGRGAVLCDLELAHVRMCPHTPPPPHHFHRRLCLNTLLYVPACVVTFAFDHARGTCPARHRSTNTPLLSRASATHNQGRCALTRSPTRTLTRVPTCVPTAALHTLLVIARLRLRLRRVAPANPHNKHNKVSLARQQLGGALPQDGPVSDGTVSCLPMCCVG